MTDNAVFTDIPTIGNHYTGDGPPPVPSFYMSRAGGYDGSRLYAPAVDGGPDAARVLALGQLPADFGDYSNGVIMVYSAFIYDESVVAVTSENASSYHYLYRKVAADSATPMPVGARGTAVRRVVRAAVHKPVADANGYATGWQLIEGFGWRNGAPRSGDPTPWTDGSISDANTPLGSQAKQFVVDFVPEGWNEIHPFGMGGATIVPTVVQVAAQRNGPNVFIYVTHDGTVNYSRTYSDANRYNGLYHVHSDLSVDHIPLHGKSLQLPGAILGDRDYFTAANWERYFYYGANVYVDESVDPTLFFLTHDPGAFLRRATENSTLVITAKLSELVGGSATVPTPPIGPSGADGNWHTSGRVGASMHAVPGRSVQLKNGSNKSAVTLCAGHAVSSWTAGNGPPELWFFVPVKMESIASLYHGTGGNPDSWSVTYDIYVSSYSHGNLNPQMTYNAATPILLDDDAAYSEGGSKFPSSNPQGLAFNPDWYSSSHKRGTLTLNNLETDFDDTLGSYPPGIPTAFYVTRNPAHRNQLVLACCATVFEMYESFGGIAENGGTPHGPQPQANGSEYSLTQIWTAVSNDNGATWKSERIVQPPVAEDISSTPPSYGELYWLDGYGEQTAVGSADVAASRFILDSAGRIVMGLTNSKVYYDKGTGVPVSFWNAPNDAGLHHGLYFPQGIGTSGAKTGATDVKFKRTQRR